MPTTWQRNVTALRSAPGSGKDTVVDIDEGETLWIYPAQWTRSGDPDGFPMRVVDLLGRDGVDPHTVWVRGVALDRMTGLPVQEIVIGIPEDQPRADRDQYVSRPAP
jgi:hypothetical protein